MVLELRGVGSPDSSRWAFILSQFQELLPAYPSFSTVPIAKVPAPPLLRGPNLSDDALQLALAYRGTINHFFGRCRHRGKCRRFCGVSEFDDLAFRDAAMLQRIAPVLRSRRIAPMAWCGFSVSAHREYVSKTRPPSALWTFSAKRIEEREAWWAWSQTKFAGGRLFVEPEHRDLIVRWERMRYALLLVRGLDEERVRRIVNSYLSPATYRKLVERLETKVETKEHEMRQAIKRNEWLWGQL